MYKKFFFICIGLSMMIFFIALYLNNQILSLVFKPIPLIILLFFIKPTNIYNKLIFIGFVFSVLGDILLEIPGDLFVFGLGAFLIAHINYIFAFIAHNKKVYPFAGIFVYLMGTVVYIVVFSSLADMRVPVGIYIFIVSTMIWRSFAQRKFSITAKYALYGAILFGFSDAIIALNRFYYPFESAQWVIMISYWSAQLLIFKSINSKMVKLLD